MILRTSLLAALLLLGGCATTRTYAPGQQLLGEKTSTPAWSAASVRARYLMQWKTRRNDLRFSADLRTLGSMGRLDLSTPSGRPLAQIHWNGDQWTLLLPDASTLVEGDGPTLPLPMLGIAEFPYREIERLARGILLPPDIQGKQLSDLYAGKGTRVLLSNPDATSRRWALHLDEKTGIVRRVQCFQGPHQESDLQILGYQPNGMIPSQVRREFDTASALQIWTLGWTEQNFVSPTELTLPHSTLLDTVSVAQDRLGRRFYTIRPSHPDSLAPFPSDFLALTAPVASDSAELSGAEEDSLDSLDTDDDPDISEDDLAPEEEAPVILQAPALPAILKESAPPKPLPVPEPAANDSVPVAHPPSASTPRRF